MQTGEFQIQTINDDTIPIRFNVLPDEIVTLDDSSFSKYLSPPVIELTKGFKEISFYQSIYMDSLKGSNLSGNINITYNIVDSNTSTVLSSFSGGNFSAGMWGTFQTTLSSNLSSFVGRNIIIVPIIKGLKNPKDMNYALVHVYLDNDIKQSKKNVVYQEDIKQGSNIVYEFNLFQNYPNPLNPSTTISYQLPKKSFVNLSIYNLLGQKITELVNKEVQSGHYSVIWDASNLSSGIYVYKLTAGGFTAIKKCILLK